MSKCHFYNLGNAFALAKAKKYNFIGIMNTEHQNEQQENLEQVENQIENQIENQVENQENTSELPLEEQLKEELEKEKDKFLRLFAEFENYKKRTTKERIELFKTANQDVLQSMLPVLDDFDRAMAEISKSEEKALVEGVQLIHNKLKDILASKGLEVVEIKAGDAFDADFAEAVTQVPAPSEDLKGKIVDVIEKGYKLGNKIIRYPKVVTGM